MHSLGDDNELDKLSRDAAGMYDNPGAPNWQKMSAELDNVLPVERKRRVAPLWWLVPAVLLVGGGAYWLMRASTSPEARITTQPVAATAKPVTSEAIKEPAAAGKVEKQAIAPGSSTAGAAEPNSATASPATRSYTNRIIQSRREHISAPAVGISSAQPVLTDQANPTVTPQVQRNEKPAAAKNSSSGETSTSASLDIDQLRIVSDEVSKTLPVPTGQATMENPQPAAEPLAVRRQEKLQPAPFGSGWSIGFVAGADKSTVKFRYGNEPGYNLGILVGYHFNSHLSLHTGAIYTQKNYKMAGEDFTAPKGSLPSYYKLENVEGYCRMWDIPLLARYTFNPTGKSNFYLSTGLSSYFMTAENYNYFYYYQGNPVTRNVNYASDDSHALSILHLSGGFETRMSAGTSLQIEPYAKLPLGGVGLGNIRLSSFGINAILQLRQPSKKQ